jgi:hypothetical protein
MPALLLVGICAHNNSMNLPADLCTARGDSSWQLCKAPKAGLFQ